jgi:ectoine hydroxylase-related dioxygenase (phytanoyl-CoA dioxygenase family)
MFLTRLFAKRRAIPRRIDPRFSPVALDVPIDLSRQIVFRAENFPDSQATPWLDVPDAEEAIARRERAGEISDEEAELCRTWVRDGYLIVRGMFSAEQIDATWSEYEALIATGELVPQEDHDVRVQNPLPGRTLNPHFRSDRFRRILDDARSVELVSLLMGVSALPFQTIAGHKGSEQLAHSDSIHMTTYPQGYLVANWIAFEDIQPDSGPLEYYPGSHRLPYTYSKQCGIGLAEGQADYLAYHRKYEPFIQNLIRDNGLDAHHFLAKKGDVLFWHANLIHGGSRIANAGSSRRALVCHYFAEGCVCYHDYTGTPSHLTPVPAPPRQLFDSAAYVGANPDVAESGLDPFDHYVRHGYEEGRPLR